MDALSDMSDDPSDTSFFGHPRGLGFLSPSRKPGSAFLMRVCRLCWSCT